MTLRVAVPTSYIHERYFGRPSCPKCGELLMAPEYSECLSHNDIRHFWMCCRCDYGFETLIRFNIPPKMSECRATVFRDLKVVWARETRPSVS